MQGACCRRYGMEVEFGVESVQLVDVGRRSGVRECGMRVHVVVLGSP